jgi:protein TonB
VQDQPATFVMVTSLPELKGGNRALRKKITYPDQAIQNKIEGVVRVQFKIDGQGDTTDFVVTEGIGYGCDDAVIRAIRDSDFTPGRGPGGSAVNFFWEVTAEFRL